MHNRGLGIDCLPHFLVAIIGTARLIIYGHPFKIEALAKMIPTVEAIEQAKILSPSGTSQRRHHSPAHGGDIIFAGKQDSIDTGPAWRIRDLLLPHLKNVAVSRREDFACVLYSRRL